MEAVTQQVIAERPDELKNCLVAVSNSQCEINGLQGGGPELQRAEEWGAEVIISRGGTATYIAERTEIPVVEIQVTALDILQAFRRAQQCAGKIGIAGCKNITYECESLKEFLHIDLCQVHLQDDYSCEELAQAVKQDGIQVLVGDALAIKFARTMGLEAYVIESGKGALYKALQEAEGVARVRRKEQSRADLLRTVIDSSTDGIIAIDETSRVTLINKVAEKFFNLKGSETIGRLANDVIPNTRLPQVLETGKAEIAEVQTVDYRQIATKRIPIITGRGVSGAVATFQEVSQLQRYEQAVRQKLHDQGLTAKFTLEQIVGESPLMKQAKQLTRAYSATESTVLITGESGTGKELFAQSIHNLSQRRNAPFVAVNCAALPGNLLESELFGYEEGAFSGAKKGGKIGLVELAHGGTLFLDEIGEMPLGLQARILRVIQERAVMRVGGHKVIPINVRILAATNQNLGKLVEQKLFREDLYYRLAVLPLHLPPLRERRQDVRLIADSFLQKYAAYHHRTYQLSGEAVAALNEYAWPGNVRELANITERLALLSPQAELGRREIETVLSMAGRDSLIDQGKGDLWVLVDELRQRGMGARKIARIAADKGYEIKYWQIAYHLDKAEKHRDRKGCN